MRPDRYCLSFGLRSFLIHFQYLYAPYLPHDWEHVQNESLQAKDHVFSLMHEQANDDPDTEFDPILEQILDEIFTDGVNIS